MLDPQCTRLLAAARLTAFLAACFSSLPTTGLAQSPTPTANASKRPSKLQPEHRVPTRHLPLFEPNVRPGIQVLRCDEDATRFARQAWGRDRQELHVDYDHELVLVASWGTFERAQARWNGPPQLLVERVRRRGDTLHVTVRTTLSLPAHRTVAAAPDKTPRALRPSRFVSMPKAPRVHIDVVGSRRAKGKLDFASYYERGLHVRVHPDETSALAAFKAIPPPERLALVLQLEAKKGVPTTIVRNRSQDRERLDICWGEHPAGNYQLELVRARIHKNTAYLTVRASNNPFGHRRWHRYTPKLSLAHPDVDHIRLHIECTGPRDAGYSRFTPFENGDLTVTVDDQSTLIDASHPDDLWTKSPEPTKSLPQTLSPSLITR
ncbi:MAG: hypothetical protein AB8H80_11380 [Planctomycetota bacterium]